MEKRHIFKKKLPFGQKQQSVQQKWGFLTGRKKVGMHAIPIFFFCYEPENTFERFVESF